MNLTSVQVSRTKSMRALSDHNGSVLCKPVNLIGLIVLSVLSSCAPVTAKFDVTITTGSGGWYYIEYVKDARFAGKVLPSNGTYTVSDVSGKETLSWVSYNKNGYGMVLDPIDQVLDVDVNSNLKISVKGSKATIE